MGANVYVLVGLAKAAAFQDADGKTSVWSGSCSLKTGMPAKEEKA